MKQFIKLFSVLVVISLVALVPSQAQTEYQVTLVINGITQPAVTTVGGVAVITVNMQGFERISTEVVGGGGDVGTGKVKLNHKQKGNVIEVAPQAVQAHLNHGDTLVPVGNAVKAEVSPSSEPDSVTLTVSGMTADVQVNVTLSTL